MQFDDEFLEKVGLGEMAGDRKESFLESIQAELELRVGRKLSEGLSDARLLEFDELAKGGDEKEIQDWIRVNRPDYKDVARSELEKLTREIAARKDEILAP